MDWYQFHKLKVIHLIIIIIIIIIITTTTIIIILLQGVGQRPVPVQKFDF
jgi:hypothetical protein